MFKIFQAKQQLKKGISSYQQAAKFNGKIADKLYNQSYRHFAKSMSGSVAMPETLYNWGLALFYQGQTKTGDEARTLFDAACEKYRAAQSIDASSPNIMTDLGVALMALIYHDGATTDDERMEQALGMFQQAEKIQPGIAAYNLACIYSLRNDPEECKKSLEVARENDELPPLEDVENDADLANVSQLEWFIEFVTPADEDDAESEASDDEEKA